jgi:hypothetical protein
LKRFAILQGYASLASSLAMTVARGSGNPTAPRYASAASSSDCTFSSYSPDAAASQPLADSYALAGKAGSDVASTPLGISRSSSSIPGPLEFLSTFLTVSPSKARQYGSPGPVRIPHKKP